MKALKNFITNLNNIFINRSNSYQI
jgi:hypothetical protein